MIQFPTLMYKSPGQNRKSCGATFNFIGVDSQEQFDAMTEKGWFSTFEEAKESAGDAAYPKAKKFNRFDVKKSKPKKPSKPLVSYEDKVKQASKVEEVEEEIDEISPPNREELEAKAKEIGIKFTKRTTDKKLEALISEQIGE